MHSAIGDSGGGCVTVFHGRFTVWCIATEMDCLLNCGFPAILFSPKTHICYNFHQTWIALMLERICVPNDYPEGILPPLHHWRKRK
ncbi:hypothetical protein XELAEV_18014535mg [Xenopus laevis]|uniref:Uncharacterized protein n=1 Tax=Xenopus laevis TaxID=8355 RepID=A0A974DIA9_XENLA|nr:hypothetical protein XELAEV_18014535mg [Xenopus laevis]